MANLGKQAADRPVRAMIVGWPGTAKTGSLAPLINAGYKMRILDFDGNLDPLFTYAKPDMLKNVDAVYLEDKMRIMGQFSEPVGIPTAFTRAHALMSHWKYKEPDGTEVDLGKSDEWGTDTILVLDSMTKMGDAAFRRAAKLLNKNPSNITQQVWMLAMAEQANFIDAITSQEHNFHVIVIAHLKMISPKDIQKGDTDLTKDIKEQAAALLPSKLFPRALGHELPQQIGGDFPILIEAFSKAMPGDKVKRMLRTIPRPDLDIKLPALGLPSELDVSDGMLQIFQKLTPASLARVSKGNASPPLLAGAVATEEVNE